MSPDPGSVRVTRADKRVSIADAARLCGVSERAVRNWITRGYYLRDGTGPVFMPAVKDGRAWYVLPVDLAKADHATAKRARRDTSLPELDPGEPALAAA